MKRQLDRLKGKRLVTGDPNLMTKDEICINATPNGVEVKEIGTDGKIKDLAGSGSGGSGDSVAGYYYFDMQGSMPEEVAELVENISNMADLVVCDTKSLLGYNIIITREDLSSSGIPSTLKKPIKAAVPKLLVAFQYVQGEVVHIVTNLFDYMRSAGFDIEPYYNTYFKTTEEEFFKDTKLNV